jgi:hypothetical protein
MNKLVLLIFISLTGCATNGPTAYNDHVEITKGPYKGERGQLIGDCSGFEYYKVRLNSGKLICERSWNMTKIGF